MRRWPTGLRTGLCICLAALLSACSPTADVTREQLSGIVERDAVAFSNGTLPAAVVDRLAANRVVILGETHHLREHWHLVATLVRDLHAHGHRQLLVEAPQMADWLIDDYVTGGELEPGLTLPPFWLRKFEPIRAFNDTLPPGERVHVRSIDANEAWYGGAAGFRDQLRLFAAHLPKRGPIDAFMAAEYTSTDAQRTAIDALHAALLADGSALTGAWNAERFAIVLEMVEVEATSVDIRAKRDTDDDAAAKAREDVIKRLADARIGEAVGGTVVNMGGHHAQKANLMGTEQEWLGEYLAHRSEVTRGDVTAIAVSSARTELEPGAGGTPWDILESSSPDNELYRLMAEALPGQDVFMWLDDSVFIDHRIAMNSEDVIYAAAFKEQFDAVLLFGLAHRMPDS